MGSSINYVDKGHLEGFLGGEGVLGLKQGAKTFSVQGSGDFTKVNFIQFFVGGIHKLRRQDFANF